MNGRSDESCLLGVDVGTTHCKAGVYDFAGNRIGVASCPTPVRRDEDARPYFDPEELWSAVAALIRETLSGHQIAVVGVAGMAEAGLLIERKTGQPRSEIIPWYDPRSSRQMDELTSIESPRSAFERSGLHPSFKYGLPKILWLRRRDPGVLDGSLWLSVPDYIVYRLTGSVVTDPTLAARTYAFDIREARWDVTWIERLALPADLFPDVRPSGRAAGASHKGAEEDTGLQEGTPVAVSGHDHVCALLGAGITAPGPILDSMGTAESLMGVMEGFIPRAFDAGLTIVPHVLPGRFCWLGGLPASGGAVEWLRRQLGDEPVSYDELGRLARDVGSEPTGILFFPYLSGSGAPWHDQNVRGAFVGLSADHRRGHLVRAVLEGTAYETLAIEEAARELTGVAPTEVVTTGGGTRNREWLQIKADVTGRTQIVPADGEAVIRGAAFTAAVGSGLMPVGDVPVPERGDTVEPNQERHLRFRSLYRQGYLRLQAPLRDRTDTAFAGDLAHV